VRVIADQLRHAHGLMLTSLVRIDRNVGNSDARARDLLAPLLAIRHAHVTLTHKQRTVLSMLGHWNRRAAGPGTGGGPGTTRSATDGPATTIFETYVDVLRHRLFGSLPASVFARASHVGSHLYEPTAMDSLALRVLRPSTSALRVSHDWLHGRSKAAVLRDALKRTIAALTKRYGSATPAKWRRAHPVSTIESLTGVVGPSLTMPFEDRGTYEHLVDLGRAG
jgi:acyl-homoserine lactone acylase PvdQ